MSHIPCPECGDTNSSVRDSRFSPNPVPNIMRRRRCVCGHRYTTKEVVSEHRRGELLDLSALPPAVRLAIQVIARSMVKISLGNSREKRRG